MKATNLSVSIPSYGCNKNCPYCISNMTGETERDVDLFYRNINKVFHIADRSDVNSISFTSKGEITAYIESIQIFNYFLQRFSPFFSCELQTNGIAFNDDDLRMLDQFYLNGLDTVAVSIDHPEYFTKFQSVFDKIKELGMTLRITVNLTPSIMSIPMEEYIEKCHNLGIDQLSFREITIPSHETVNTEKSRRAEEWIREVIDRKQVRDFLDDYFDFICRRGHEVWKLPYGATIYDVDGISLTRFDYCIQDVSGDNDIRSLIFHEDGHLSTSWYGSNVGRIL